MKLNLRFLRLRDSKKHRSMIKSELEPLALSIPFDHAHVTLSKPQEGSDQVEASVHLAIPGPDIRAKATDYTVEAAWRKLGRAIREIWKRRLRKRDDIERAPRMVPTRARG